MPSTTLPLSARRFEAVLFDLGATLIFIDGDQEDIYRRSNEELCTALQNAGLSLDRGRFIEDFSGRMRQYFNERDTEFIEYTTAYILRTLLSEYGLHDLPDSLIVPALKARYAVPQSCWKPETDAVSTLKALKERGLLLGLISNAGDDADVQVLINQSGLRPYFDAVITSASLGIRKPNPRIFQIMLETLGVKADRAVMVGDTLGADILGARNTGIYSVWITRRANTAANRSHVDTITPDARIHDLTELLDIIE